MTLTAMKNRIENRIRAAMDREKAPFFFSLDTALLAASFPYALGAGLRKLAYDHGLVTPRRLPCPVISVGNLCLGGTGKTPMTLYVAKTLGQMGIPCAVVSRGYGGGLKTGVGIVSNAKPFIWMPKQPATNR